MFSATDWALKRVLKFVLKKSIGRYLQSEPDLEQLDVQLSTGTFELRNVLLKCEAVNSELVRAVHVVHGCCATTAELPCMHALNLCGKQA